MMKSYYTPLNFPTIVPDNWDKFWKMWNEKSDRLVKFKNMHDDIKIHVNMMVNDSNIWRGILVYDPDSSMPNNSLVMPIVDIRDELPNMFNDLMSLKPFFKTYHVSIIESLRSVISHSDTKVDTWMVRSFLSYPSPTPQWYFTKPHDREGKRTYINPLPETNWFAFNDSIMWHGTDWNEKYPKVLIKIYGEPHDYVIKENLERYKDHALCCDNE